MLRKRNARFVLDRSSNKKTECPNCGKKEFRKYVDRLTGTQLPDRVGICERINNCGYVYTASMYMKDGGSVEQSSRTTIPVQPAPRTDWRCPDKVFEATMGGDQWAHSNFMGWMKQMFDHEDIVRVAMDYRVGVYPVGKKHPEMAGAMVYWQIGSDDKPRSGKVIQYDESGKRRKDIKATWVHTIVTDKSMSDIGCAQVLFGEHLLKQRPDAPVAIVEGEKTALICACLYPDYVWLATGGSHGLQTSKCVCLSGRDVVILPDAGMYSDKEMPNGQIRDGWVAQAMAIEPLTKSLHVSDVLEAIGAPEGDDIGDWLVPSNRLRQMGVDLFPNEQPKELADVDDIPEFWEEKWTDEKVEEHQAAFPDGPKERIMAMPGVDALFKELDLDKNNITLRNL